ncbi:29709_t:CDS:1, partial [Racocetra persica]
NDGSRPMIFCISWNAAEITESSCKHRMCQGLHGIVVESRDM